MEIDDYLKLEEVLTLPTQRLMEIFKRYHEPINRLEDYLVNGEDESRESWLKALIVEKNILKEELDKREHVPTGPERKKVRKYMQQKKVTEQEARVQLGI